uniref:Uncharacterized protein n=1 Tax=Romanomermis culicivorax TaxID=13658 RepID=A0A915HGV7_ROMCU
MILPFKTVLIGTCRCANKLDGAVIRYFYRSAVDPHFTGIDEEFLDPGGADDGNYWLDSALDLEQARAGPEFRQST